MSLQELLGPLAPGPHAVRRAEAFGLGRGEPVPVEMVQLDAPEPPGTSEFVVLDPDAARRWRAPFGVRVDGHSMAPEIQHGDVVLLSPDCAAEEGKPAVIQLAGQIGVTCKLYRSDGRCVHLISVSDRHPPTRHPLEQLLWALKVLARIRPA